MLIKAQTFQIETVRKMQLVDITDKVRRFLAETDVWNGIGQVEEGRLILGQFQRLVVAELDGPRLRSVRMQFMGEGVPHQTGDLHRRGRVE